MKQHKVFIILKYYGLRKYRKRDQSAAYYSCEKTKLAVYITFITYITVVCPRLLTVGDSVVLFFFSFLFFNFIQCPCNVFDVIVSP